jgi:hypothetical protein
MSKTITLTKSRIKQIVKEEVHKFLNEEGEDSQISKEIDDTISSATTNIDTLVSNVSSALTKLKDNPEVLKLIPELTDAAEQLIAAFNEVKSNT